MRPSAIPSDILRYIVEQGYKPGDQLPTIQDISKNLGVSVSKVRESLEVARTLGMVEIKPGRGSRVSDYRFTDAVAVSALYAVAQDSSAFRALREMRSALEIAFWQEAVSQLQPEDMAHLQALVNRANALLSREPIQVPAQEHRSLHLTIFSRLDNPFVLGVLEAYWDVYEAFGMNLHVSLDYLRTVWDYHARIVDAIEAHQYEQGRQLLKEHMHLLRHRESVENGIVATGGTSGQSTD
ncbi:MAG: FadR family transcriptional regulator [Chloroflexi bacterium]|nr:FadR family transcriptional regulator [Chloroflexota bacterium]